MREFDLGERFDVVTCLFSSIGYVRGLQELDRAIAAMARHVAAGGLLVIEPWFAPEDWGDGHIFARFVDEPDLKLARMNRGDREGDVAVMDMHYLVLTREEGVQHFTERHEMTLFTQADYMRAFEKSGLEVEFDPDGLMGRGLYVGTRPVTA
jgi:SAM-dependent methyltransferase